jgi:hypothetical protein
MTAIKAAKYVPYPFPLHCGELTFQLATSAKVVRGRKGKRERVAYR